MLKLLLSFLGLSLALVHGSENVQSELKTWLDKVAKEPILESKKSSALSSEQICYTEQDVASVFALSGEKSLENLDGSAKLTFKDQRHLEAKQFKQGLAQGLGKIILPSNSRTWSSNQSYLVGNFANGCFNGIVKAYQYLPLDGVRGLESEDEPLVYTVAFYKDGLVQGPAWQIINSIDGIILGYFYVEKPENKGTNLDLDITAKNVIFLYPDLLHGIKGQFHPNGVLISGHRGMVVSQKTSSATGIKEIQFEEESHPSLLKSDIATKSHLSSNPLTRDPFEQTLIDVQKSNIPKANDGVFLLADVKANQTVGYFNGIRLYKSDVFSWNPFKKSSVYIVETQDESGNDMYLDIPAKFASWNSYKASAGHKVNHGKKNANSGYTDCVHPIFGKILCLYVFEDLPAGTELLTKYEVALDKEGMKSVLKAALEVGHRYVGKSRKEFAKEIRPYLEMASKFADKIDADFLLSF